MSRRRHRTSKPPPRDGYSRSDRVLTVGVVAALCAVIIWYLFFSDDAGEVNVPAESTPVEEPI